MKKLQLVTLICMGLFLSVYANTNATLRLGLLAGDNASTGEYEIYVGTAAGYGAKSNVVVIAIGLEAMKGSSNNFNIVAVGVSTLQDAVNCTNVVAIGSGVGRNETGKVNRVWIDHTARATGDDSSIAMTDTNLVFGQTNMPVLIRGNLDVKGVMTVSNVNASGAMDVTASGYFGTGTRNTGADILQLSGTNPQMYFKRAAIGNSMRMWYMTGNVYNWHTGMLANERDLVMYDGVNNLVKVRVVPGATLSETLIVNGSNGIVTANGSLIVTNSMTVSGLSYIKLPTTAQTNGLASGILYNDAGTPKIMP